MAGARIAIVGDVHGFWNTKLDGAALRFLKPDMVLFTGDFGDEDVELVQEVSKLDMPNKLAILGNHDCWWSGLRSDSHKLSNRHPQKKKSVPVDLQLEALGDSHIGYKRKDFPEWKLSVIGGRPFTIGGSEIFNLELVAHLYDIWEMEASVKKITELALSAPEGHSLIFLAHNGPTGLGNQPDDICGNDFELGGGDHGDPDLAEALKRCRQADCRMPLVVFGHMHRQLCLVPGERKMCAVDKHNTVYVNGAIVPRCTDQGRNFTMVELSPDSTSVVSITETWVTVSDDVHVADEQTWFPLED